MSRSSVQATLMRLNSCLVGEEANVLFGKLISVLGEDLALRTVEDGFQFSSIYLLPVVRSARHNRFHPKVRMACRSIGCRRTIACVMANLHIASASPAGGTYCSYCARWLLQWCGHRESVECIYASELGVERLRGKQVGVSKLIIGYSLYNWSWVGGRRECSNGPV